MDKYPELNRGGRLPEDIAASADALLFAAAPDLLAALEGLCADKYLSDPINTERMRNARAAIAKAKGLTQQKPTETK